MNTIQQQLTTQAEGISCFAWNADRSMIAICPNNNEIHIYSIIQHSDSWQKKFTLCEVPAPLLFVIQLSIVDEVIPGYISERFFILPFQHDLLVSSIDWSPRTNKIVSCSHDRNAFVWTFDDESQVWKPTLVILRIDRAATDVKWSLDGRRFAVASSAKMVPVCMYESGNDWYVNVQDSNVACCANEQCLLVILFSYFASLPAAYAPYLFLFLSGGYLR